MNLKSKLDRAVEESLHRVRPPETTTTTKESANAYLFAIVDDVMRTANKRLAHAVIAHALKTRGPMTETELFLACAEEVLTSWGRLNERAG